PTGDDAPFDRVALALLFAADRLDHVACEIKPHLTNGGTVICDRYVLSYLAYQGMDAPREWVERINSFAPRPDLTIYLDCEPEVAFGRINSRSDAKEIFETPRTLQRVALAYRESIRLLGDAGLVELDGNLPADDVADLVWKSVEHLFTRV
ncbi:MAG: dTMP kinase, partial [Deltaproteobacteria bacterium]|nr:dTMP kinase [Deltaproteobacteria bacterium]